jgi:putative transposase
LKGEVDPNFETTEQVKQWVWQGPVEEVVSMARKRRTLSAQFKARVALAAVKGDKTLSELAHQYAVHPTQIGQWKARLLEGAAEVFQDGRRKSDLEQANAEELYEQIGRLKMEVEWLKKKAAQLQ